MVVTTSIFTSSPTVQVLVVRLCLEDCGALLRRLSPMSNVSFFVSPVFSLNLYSTVAVCGETAVILPSYTLEIFLVTPPPSKCNSETTSIWTSSPTFHLLPVGGSTRGSYFGGSTSLLRGLDRSR